MTATTFAISVLPPFSVIGWIAPWVFSLLIFLQSFAAAGEFAGGMLYLIEASPVHKRGFYGSFSFFGLSLGMAISSLNYFLFGVDLSEEQFFMWGWRILYCIGALVGLGIFFLRRRFPETHLFLEARSALKGETNPIIELFNHHKIALFKAFGIGVLETAAFNLLIGFLIHYWVAILRMPLALSLKINFWGMACFPIFIISLGKLSEFWHIKRQAIASALLFSLFSLPLFLWMEHGEIAQKMAIFILLLFLMAGYMVTLPGIFCELFPTRVRFIGVSLGYNLAVAGVGSTAPDAIFYLARWIPPGFDIGMYLTLSALFSLFILLKTREKILSIP